MVRKNSLEMVIEAKDEASKVISNATKNLDTSFKEVEKALRNTTKEFGSLNSSLRKLGVDAAEIDKINQEIKQVKPEILENEIRNVQERLKKLGADASYIEKVTEQMRKAQKEASEMAKEVGKLSSETGKGFDIGAMKTQAFEGAVGGLKGGLLGLAAVLGAATIAQGKFMVEMHDMELQFQAATGASEEAAATMDESFRRLVSYGRSAKEEIAETLILTQQTFRNMNSAEIESIANKTLIATEALRTLGAGQSDIIRGARQLMINFGVDTSTAFDMIVAGYQNGLNVSGDFIDTIEEYGPLFKQAGYDANQFLNELNSGMQSGARNTDFVADAIKEFNIRLRDGSETTSNALKQLFGGDLPKFEQTLRQAGGTGKAAMDIIIQRIFDIEDPVQRNIIGVALFGTKWEDLGETAVKALGDTEVALKNVEGATDRAGQAIDQKLTSRWQRFWSTVQMGVSDIISGIGRITGDALSDRLTRYEKRINLVSGLFKEDPKPIQDDINAERKQQMQIMNERTNAEIQAENKKATARIQSFQQSKEATDRYVDSIMKAVNGDYAKAASTGAVSSGARSIAQAHQEAKDAVEEYKKSQLETVDFQEAELDKRFEIRKAQLDEEKDKVKLLSEELQHYNDKQKLIQQELALLEEKYAFSKKLKGEDAEVTRQLKLEILDLQLAQAKLSDSIQDATKALKEQQSSKISVSDGSIFSEYINSNGDRVKVQIGTVGIHKESKEERKKRYTGGWDPADHTDTHVGGFKDMPRYANGTNFHPGGPAIVGEEGIEVVNLPRGASVTPNNQLDQLFSFDYDRLGRVICEQLNQVLSKLGNVTPIAVNVYGNTFEDGNDLGEKLNDTLRRLGL